jgi:hypothetical protein
VEFQTSVVPKCESVHSPWILYLFFKWKCLIVGETNCWIILHKHFKNFDSHFNNFPHSRTSNLHSWCPRNVNVTSRTEREEKWISRMFVKENEVLVLDSQYKIWKFRYSFQNGSGIYRHFRPVPAVSFTNKDSSRVKLITHFRLALWLRKRGLSSGLYDLVLRYVGSSKNHFKLKEEHKSLSGWQFGSRLTE